MKINTMLFLLILIFNVNCSKDSISIDGSYLSEDDITLALKIHNEVYKVWDKVAKKSKLRTNSPITSNIFISFGIETG